MCELPGVPVLEALLPADEAACLEDWRLMLADGEVG